MVTFKGKVQKGHGRGKDLGFPSANVNLHTKIPEGIYISQTKITSKTYQSLTFIGQAKSFNETKYHSETYLLDYQANLYNKWISVNLIKKIRANQKFAKVLDLIKQMQEDEKVARNYFKKNV